jgi:hypothetical protein
MSKEYKVKDRLNKFAEELEEINDVRLDEKALIQKCITLMQYGESEKSAMLLCFNATEEIINRLFDLSNKLRKDIWAILEE